MLFSAAVNFSKYQLSRTDTDPHIPSTKHERVWIGQCVLEAVDDDVGVIVSLFT